MKKGILVAMVLFVAGCQTVLTTPRDEGRTKQQASMVEVNTPPANPLSNRCGPPPVAAEATDSSGGLGHWVEIHDRLASASSLTHWSLLWNASTTDMEKRLIFVLMNSQVDSDPWLRHVSQNELQRILPDLPMEWRPFFRQVGRNNKAQLRQYRALDRLRQEHAKQGNFIKSLRIQVAKKERQIEALTDIESELSSDTWLSPVKDTPPIPDSESGTEGSDYD